MTHVVVAIIIKPKPLSYLLVSSKKDFGEYSGYYYPPAGHLKKNENELFALRREIKEELGLNIIEAKKITDTMGDVKNQKTSWYICNVDSLNFTYNKNELKDAGFFTQLEIESMKVWPATLSVLKKHIFGKDNTFESHVSNF